MLDTYKQVYHQTEIRLNYAMLQFARDFSHLCEVLLKYEQYEHFMQDQYINYCRMQSPTNLC